MRFLSSDDSGRGGGSGGDRSGGDGTNDGGVIDDVVGGVSGHVFLYGGEGVVYGVLLVGHGWHVAVGHGGHVMSVGEGGYSLHLSDRSSHGSHGVVGQGKTVAKAMAVSAVEKRWVSLGLGISLTLLSGSLDYRSSSILGLGRSGGEKGEAIGPA